MQQFAQFGLPDPLLSALKTIHYEQPTPIQQQAIPAAMEGKDIIGIAQTGTGKTAAFGVPTVVALANDPNLQALVLAPTRELALQIHEVASQLTQNYKQIKPWVLIGGVPMHSQARALPRRPRWIIATPGRLIDHMEQRTFSWDSMRHLVLDEADRMLDIGFEPQIRRVLRILPPKRQTMLFSATFPREIEKLSKDYLINPVMIRVGKVTNPVAAVNQMFVNTTNQEKNAVLIRELRARAGSVLIFARTKHRTDRLTRALSQSGFSADRIHGDRTQGQRVRAMENFRSQKVRILVATDIASRGIDVPHIAHVINYDLPQVAEDYIHRIGRTARAGAKGESLCLVTPEDGMKWRELRKVVASHAASIV